MVVSVCKAMDKVEFFSNLQKVHHSRNQWDQGVIATHEDCEQIGEAGRFKKRESSKDYAEEFGIKLYTSQDIDMRFIFLNIVWISDSMSSWNICQNNKEHNRFQWETIEEWSMESKEERQTRVSPQTYTFNLLLQSLCEHNILDHALQLFNKISEKGRYPNEFTVGTLVRGFCRAGKTKEALEFIDSKLCFNVNRVVYNTLVSSFGKKDMNDEAEKLVERMREKGLFPDVIFYV
ncbi:pentatricopeptide repeat-containing protein At1g63400-like [Lathyrus oleraceus]|uniref:pentatricopeptide repeat-containing protein At1g63400-like n=1 Tax=Pisum sativum TaxID=3888 RepID=UPI0021D0AA19|nr:pentatricopeptide repeat-containing protein At1g63400-like [Pisum sativum]